MAEIVEYRIEKGADECKLLVDFGLLDQEQVKEILKKRENFEYKLRKRNRSKLDFLKYIRYEVNFLESIDKYRKSVIKCYYKSKKKDVNQDLDQKILLLQAKKLNDIVRSRCAHISSLYRKLTTSFQFDKTLWLAYIEFAKSRKWNTKVSALYWRMLRVLSNDCDIWLEAASHEVVNNRAFDAARYLYLRALRHHPTESEVWANYLMMELQFLDVVDQRARIVFNLVKKEEEKKKEGGDENIWDDDESEMKYDDKSEVENDDEPINVNQESELELSKEEPKRQVKPTEQNDKILAGHLVKVVYDKAIKSLDNHFDFLVIILNYLTNKTRESKGLEEVNKYICKNIKARSEDGSIKIPKELAYACVSTETLKNYLSQLKNSSFNEHSNKKQKVHSPTRLDLIYECYEEKGLKEARKLFITLEQSVKNRSLSLYVAMIQVECWQLPKNKSLQQLNRIRSIYDKALAIFGKNKPKLWYEYIQFEFNHAKTLDDFNRINQIYSRAQVTLDKTKVDKVIERYTLIQAKTSKQDIEYSDYSDLDD